VGLAETCEPRFRAQIDALSIGQQEQQQQTEGEAGKQRRPEPRPASPHEVPHDPHAHERQEGRAATGTEQAVPDDGHQADADPNRIPTAEAKALAREQQQERAREAEFECFADVARVGPEKAIRLSVDGVESARMDDLVDPGDQPQGRERDGRAHSRARVTLVSSRRGA
jgi:hypothetical protein